MARVLRKRGRPARDGFARRARRYRGPLLAAAAALLAVVAMMLRPSAAVAHPQQGGAAPDTAAITPAMVEAGRALFHGRGTCFACHGAKLEGTQLAPTLIKTVWRDAKNGELGNIFNVVTHGVPGTLMIAFPGGISKGDAAIAASYVWSVNHRGAKP